MCKLKLLLLYLWAGLMFISFSSLNAIAQNEKVITSDLLRQHIYRLADDKMEGRDTPSRGLDSAAAYLAKYFKQLDIAPAGGKYFHDVGLMKRQLGPRQAFSVIKAGNTTSFDLKEGFIPFETIRDTSISASLVFVGYGIRAPELNFDEYQNIDVKGKIVVAMTHSPAEKNMTPSTESLADYRFSSNLRKIETARITGAAGIILVTDPLNHILLKPKGYPWPSLLKMIPGNAEPLVLESVNTAFTAIHAGEEFIRLVFGSVDQLKNLQKKINQELKPVSYPIPDIQAEITTTLSPVRFKADNVVAIIPGTDPVLKDQILVLGAHYDHIGKLNDSDDKEEDIIFNGADDNASGTAAVMAIAEAFAKSERQPARTVIFALFAAEEIGLLGSTSLLNQPPFATDSVVAMLNFDMVSRGGPDTLYLEGHSRTPELSDIILKYAPDLGIHPVTNNRESIGGSDHASFIRKGIPAIHFFSGIHKDYHQVSDNPDTIDPDKASRVSRLGFRTAWEIANSDRKFILLPSSSKP